MPIRQISADLHPCVSDALLRQSTQKEAIIYEIGASWCSHCVQFKQYYDSAIGQTQLRNYSVLNMDVDQNRETVDCLISNDFLRSDFGVPTFLIFGNDGQFQSKIDGFSTPDDLLKKLNLLITGKT